MLTVAILILAFLIVVVIMGVKISNAIKREEDLKAKLKLQEELYRKICQ
jgi:sensor domain CHASE-containing protein